MRKLWWGLLILPLLALLGGLWTTPAVAAYLCPACFGLVNAGERIYVEPDTPDISQTIAKARARVAAFYGGFTQHPELLICQTSACQAKLGSGGARAVTYGTSFIYVSPRGLEVTYLAHEFSHIELHARIGLWGMLAGDVPAWFDEGMAVLVSQDQRYFGPDNRLRNCTPVPISNLPVSRKEWRRLAGSGQAPTLYHDAACAVQARLVEKGGLSAAMIF